MANNPPAAAGFTARTGTWQRRMLRFAKLVGLTVTDVRPGAALLSRSGNYRVDQLAEDRAYLVTNRRQGGQVRRHRLNEQAWLVAAETPDAAVVDVAKVGPRGWFVAERDTSTMADLHLETQTMKHLAAKHTAWLLRRFGVDCVIDVGANTGQFAQELRAHGFRGHIVSFEPVPDFVEQLEKLSADDDRWSVRQIALGSTEGTIPIRVQHSLSSALTATEYGRGRFVSLREFAGTEPIEVPLRRLDGMLDELLEPVVASGIERPRVFLKMDTQGFDLEVFRGLGDRVEELVGLQSEVALLLIYEQMPRMQEAIGTYEAAGFEITGLFPVTRERDGRVIEYDCMMVRPSALPA